jgi:two-component system, sensor histidine kinase PdtaS
MIKYLLLAIGVWLSANAYCQPLTGPAAVAGYSPAQKQLLVRSTATFIQFLNQQSLDKDTVMMIACRITGIPFLLAWAEDPDHTSFSPGAQWINAGNIAPAIRLFESLRGKPRTHSAIELATWYLHQPGAYRNDLDSAKYFIRAALAGGAGDSSEHYVCLSLLADYQNQSGNIEASKKIYLQLTTTGDKTLAADAWLHLATLHQRMDAADLYFADKALAGFEVAQSSTKEIECLYSTHIYRLRTELPLAKHELERILELQRSIGFKHSLFAQYQLCYMSILQTKYIGAMALADSAFANMQWAEMPDLASIFTMRIGVAYLFLGKNDEALAMYKKALEHASRRTELFWFKSMLFACTLLSKEGKWQEELDLVTKLTADFPPITPWQKAQELTTKAECYRHFHLDRLADNNQRAFLKLYDTNPDLDPLTEFEDDIREIADYYIARSDFKTARLFSNKLMLLRSIDAVYGVDIEQIFYKLDSAQGRFDSAFVHYMRYKMYSDSLTNLRQRDKYEEITARFAAEKKDAQIKLLQQDQQLQVVRLQHEKATRNWILAVVALLLVILGLLVWNARLKQRTNSYLRRLLDEKEWLVKEIHHRVKNNLHMIAGLLDSQAGFVKTEEAASAIRISQQRVNAMSLVHQKLYQTGDLSTTDMAAYIHELVAYLDTSMNCRPRIRFVLEVERLRLDLKQTIPLCLILNEAVTNAIKYAFPGERQGEISIRLHKQRNGGVLLEVADNGVGVSPAVMGKTVHSMGMSLMRGLSDDLDADFSISSDGGTKIAIVFAAAPTI